MNKQNGFSVVEGLLIVLVIAIVGFGGWYVWNNNKTPVRENIALNQDDANNADSNSNKDTTQAIPTELPSGWEEVSSAEVPFTFGLPKGWKADAATKDLRSWVWQEKFGGYSIGYNSDTDELYAISAGEGATLDEAKKYAQEREVLRSNLTTPVYVFGFSDAEQCTSTLVFRASNDSLATITIGGSSTAESGQANCDEVKQALSSVALSIQLK